MTFDVVLVEPRLALLMKRNIQATTRTKVLADENFSQR